ncbi:MAG: DUF1700 domain-containing protein [Oscillospiraceae bacterium]|nr:DUF1700 domain-containing protein [Oscillospiraceae bacterium]
MTKLEYLAALEKALKAKGVGDCADIMEEYAAHFDLKTADGYGEEEIAARLGAPKEIAAQFEETGSKEGGRTGNKLISAIGLFFADIFAGSIFLILYVWLVVLGVLSLAFVALGVMSIIGGIAVFGLVLIPPMPFLSGLLLGIMFFALAILSAFGLEYCRLYTRQLLRVYLRWHKAVWSGTVGQMPPVQKHPTIPPKKRRIMRGITLAALMIFIITLIVGTVSLMLAAGSFEPWHVWGWFR